MREEDANNWPDYVMEAIEQAGRESRTNLNKKLDSLNTEVVEKWTNDPELTEPYEVDNWSEWANSFAEGSLLDVWKGRQQDEELAQRVIEEYEEALPAGTETV
jgi:hypothetical protein